MSRTRQEEWERLPSDPDPERDLGYELLELDVFRAEDRPDSYMVLPKSDEWLREDAFIVVGEGGICRLSERR